MPSHGPSLLDPALSFAADILDDLERVHTANANRLRDGLGLPPGHPDLAWLAAMVEMLKKAEHKAVLNLQRKMRKHPLGAWCKAQRGIGERQGARLLAAIGDPYIRPEILNEDGSIRSKEGPRTVSALWAYCGLHVLSVDQRITDAHDGCVDGDQHGDPGQCTADAHTPSAGVAAKRRKGVRSNWSSVAKMRAYLVAKSCVRQKLDPRCEGGQDHVVPACACSPYRIVYDARRAHTVVTHPEWTPLHALNDALRVTSKEILKDLWRAARDYHEGETLR